METICSLQPRQVARQVLSTGTTRVAIPLRPRRGVPVFSGNRRSLRPRVLACVATAEVEQAEEIQTPEAAAAPSEAVERKQPVENVDSRRRGRPGQQRRPKKEVIYNINDLAVGQEVDAVVVGVTTYGAFVDYGAGKDALIHISQLMDGFVENTADVVQVGQEVKARVINLDLAANKVGLTLRSQESANRGARPRRDREEGGEQGASNGAPARQQKFDGQRRMPARQGGDRAPRTPLPAVGDEITGKVSRTAGWGVFVDLENNIRGLLHADEVAVPEGGGGRDPNIRAMFSEGDEIKVRVIRVDSKSRKVDLSQRSEEERAADKKMAEKGAGTVKVSGMNSLQAALARAGVQKTDFVDLSEAPEEDAQAAAVATPVPAEQASPPVTAEEPQAEAAEEPAAPTEEPAPEEPAVPEAVQEAITEAAEEVQPEAVTIAEPEQEPDPVVEAALSNNTAEAAPAEEEAAPAPAAEAAGPAVADVPVKVDAKSVKSLRDKTGAGMMDAKKALIESAGDIDKAVEYLRKKGLASADKKAGRVAAEGIVASYIHAGSRLGVLVEVNCETDFVARGDKFKELVADMAMQIAASAEVTVVSVEDVPADIIKKETDIEMGKEDILSKSEQIRGKIVEGRIAKTLKTMALLEQPFIKDTDKTVATLIKEAVSTLGENIQVRRFERFVLGEGIEKRSSDLAKEVEEQTKAFEEAAAKKAAEAAAAPAAEAATAAPAVEEVKVDAKAVKALRQATGAGMMDAKKALMQCGGDIDKATEFLRKKGLASADKKAGRVAAEGAIGAYIHAGSRLGVLVEVNCETDFVARGDKFKELVADMAMQIAACDVSVVAAEDAPAEEVERERAIEMQKEDIQSKPEAIRGKIVEGRVAKIFKERALLEQAFIKDTSKTVAEHIKAQVAAIGENIQVRRFSRYVLGEGIEKRSDDFAAEVAAATGKA
ncbi:hypothetical protein WJX75_002062 [Coccomyxa subellipsoidea]|uniref:Elongation factor Ts, mitochondrial n=1 Tax=Coccomyxa subellipsoidea TaxID=248742 RepID=A0ABR2YSW0_9CHLO